MNTNRTSTCGIPSRCLSPRMAASKAFVRREVLPYAPDAWYVPNSVKVGYEISFTRHFYKPQPLRPLEEIRADMLALEQETEGLLTEIVGVDRVSCHAEQQILSCGVESR